MIGACLSRSEDTVLLYAVNRHVVTSSFAILGQQTRRDFLYSSQVHTKQKKLKENETECSVEGNPLQ